MKPLLILICVFVAGFGLYLYKHSHHRNLAADSEKLRATIQRIFQEAGKSPLSQNRLIKELKQRFHVNEKVALVLISRARREGIIKVEEGQVTLVEE
ncbi:MAG: hypothetical protein IJ722_07185 [Alloprevotella sp.]|nr:hypothetical protein [Alloprevotella sp.]